ncbi:glycosyltransferase family 4 protein [Ectobacillus antri]|uniref:glycosyltransferase family 4 protein n=1 Tax=Ectobacillus antri TaxID=2486280 RepID=UPI000F597AC9|nr:glycosyltransferase family 4 protein [Ectobacillus antri]
MPNKILFCATVDFHFKAFHLPYMRWFQERGWEVHVAAAGDMELPYTDKRYYLSIQRSPFHLANIKAYREIHQVIHTNEFQIIHAHTPMGGMLARLAARHTRKFGTNVFYTAHGFHFCKGAPFWHWLLYYPIEKILSHYTDCLITINQEDYVLAQRLHASKVVHVHGVGVDTTRFQPADSVRKLALREKLGYQERDFLLFYAAEFNRNKNQQLLIQVLAHIKNDVPHIRLLLAGIGPLQEQCRQLARKLGVEENVDFLGYRNDLDQVLPACDIAVASSLREGLPVNIMEAMACGLPVVATANRGHLELVHDGVNGYIVSEENVRKFATNIYKLSQSTELVNEMGKQNQQIIMKYAISSVKRELCDIYDQFNTEGRNGTESKYYRAYL